MVPGPDIYEISIPDVPPSLNSMGFGAGGRKSAMKMHRLKKKLEGQLVIALMEARVPKDLVRVYATASLRFKTKHKRDEGNFRFLLEKALGDALQVNGHLEDDSDEEFRFGTLKIEKVTGHPRSTITLEVWR